MDPASASTLGLSLVCLLFCPSVQFGRSMPKRALVRLTFWALSMSSSSLHLESGFLPEALHDSPPHERNSSLVFFESMSNPYPVLRLLELSLLNTIPKAV